MIVRPPYECMHMGSRGGTPGDPRELQGGITLPLSPLPLFIMLISSYYSYEHIVIISFKCRDAA